MLQDAPPNLDQSTLPTSTVSIVVPRCNQGLPPAYATALWSEIRMHNRVGETEHSGVARPGLGTASPVAPSLSCYMTSSSADLATQTPILSEVRPHWERDSQLGPGEV